MRRGPLTIAVCLSLVVSIALASNAGAFGGHGVRGGGGRPSGFHQSAPNHGFRGSGFKGFNPAFNGFPRGFNGFDSGFNGYNRSFPGLDGLGFRGFPRSRGNAGLGSFIPWGSTTTVWASPPSYDYGYGFAAPTYDPATYYAPAYPLPAPYASPAGGSISVAPAPLAPPPPSVVSLPGGRYELRGDGAAAPYQWVWVPNPPSAPPPPPAAPPAARESAPGRQAPAADEPPARRSQLYRWTDEQGIVHWTNQAEAVPAKYRSQAKYGPS
jgi:hypothetical protein